MGMLLRRSLLAACTMFLAIGCAAETGASADGSSEDDYTKRGKVQLLVTVDWEGRDLRDDNLRAMADLHAKFPDVKIVHFLNAAYFTKQGAVGDDVANKMASVVAPIDEKGLHIHGWKRLFEASGVTFKGSPTFWGTSLYPQQCFDDCGHEVPISEYASDDLRKVVKFSLDTLESHGLGRARSFRTGGWMARQSVRDAVAAEGLVFEHSAVPTEFLQPKLGSYPVYGWLSDLWKGTTRTSQPFTLSTASQPLTEVPDNGCLADYMSADQMVDVYEANKAAWLADKKKNVVVSIGFHEETAATYLPALEDALGRILAEAKAERVPLVSITSDALAVR
jgi:hypothetical protein